MNKGSIDALYPITDHTSFYVRYGWRYLTEVNCDGEVSHMYVKTKME